MSALIYDSTSQAFKEVGGAKVYSSGDSAYADSEGKVWDSTNQAWVDAWASRLVIYDNGVEHNPLTADGWKSGNASVTAGTKYSDHFNVASNIQTANILATSNKINFAKYKTLTITYKSNNTNPGYYIVVGISLDKNTSTGAIWLSDSSPVPNVSTKSTFSFDVTQYTDEYYWFVFANNSRNVDYYKVELIP